MGCAGHGLSMNSDNGSVHKLADEVFFKARYLQSDFQALERSAELMEDVGLLDKTIRLASGEMEETYLDAEDLAERRRYMESMVRMSIPYDENNHSSRAQYNQVILQETAKRLKRGDLNGSSFV